MEYFLSPQISLEIIFFPKFENLSMRGKLLYVAVAHCCCQQYTDCVNKEEVRIDTGQAADISATQRIWRGIHIIEVTSCMK